MATGAELERAFSEHAIDLVVLDLRLSRLQGAEVYVCGSLKMVEAAIPAFMAHGLGQDACFSDAFLPAGGSPQV